MLNKSQILTFFFFVKKKKNYALNQIKDNIHDIAQTHLNKSLHCKTPSQTPNIHESYPPILQHLNHNTLGTILQSMTQVFTSTLQPPLITLSIEQSKIFMVYATNIHLNSTQQLIFQLNNNQYIVQYLMNLNNATKF